LILPDVNVLLYAVNTATEQHAAALNAIKGGYSSPRGIGFAWVSLLAFLRLSTRSGIFPKPLSVDDAIRVTNHWIDAPNAQLVHPGERHAELLGRLLRGAGTTGNLTTDAHLAAIAMEHDATIVSFDRDFARFADVRWANPGDSRK
jgi:uncharacterized protein